VIEEKSFEKPPSAGTLIVCTLSRQIHTVTPPSSARAWRAILIPLLYFASSPYARRGVNTDCPEQPNKDHLQESTEQQPHQKNDEGSQEIRQKKQQIIKKTVKGINKESL
jgi:hypothetical protein